MYHLFFFKKVWKTEVDVVVQKCDTSIGEVEARRP